MSRGYGWKPDLPDKRDQLYAIERYRAVRSGSVPVAVDLRKDPRMPPVVDQGQTSSCVGNSIAGLLDFLHPDPEYKSGVFMPSSRRFIYWGARVLEHAEDTDGGALIRDGMKTVAAGIPHELACRFDPAKINVKPNKVAFTQAERRRKIATYHPLNTVEEMMACLADGVPFVFGFTVYSAFESDEVAQTGQLNMPNLKKETVLGGHAVMACGYDQTSSRFIVRNSWGTQWGMPGGKDPGGYFTMPFAYLEDSDLADDFWTARL